MVATGGTVSAAPPTVPAQGDLTRNSVKVHAVFVLARACVPKVVKDFSGTYGPRPRAPPSTA